MSLNRSTRYRQLPSNLLVGLPCGYQVEYLRFALSQPQAWPPPRAYWPPPPYRFQLPHGTSIPPLQGASLLEPLGRLVGLTHHHLRSVDRVLNSLLRCLRSVKRRRILLSHEPNLWTGMQPRASQTPIFGDYAGAPRTMPRADSSESVASLEPPTPV